MAKEAKKRNAPCILFIDDEVHHPNQTAYEYLYYMNGAGMETDTALSARDAVAHIERKRQVEDLVVLDIMMDDDIEIDGVWYEKDLAGVGILEKRLRNARFHYYFVPILVLTNLDLTMPRITALSTYPLVTLAAKSEVLPFQLPDRIFDILKVAE